jgi:hypothetical protein
MLIKQPGLGWRSTAHAARQYPQHEHLTAQRDGQNIALSHGVAGFDDPYFVHTDFAARYQLGCQGSAFQ